MGACPGSVRKSATFDLTEGASFVAYRQVVTTIMAMEALRTRLDNLTWEKNQLEAENRRLRDEHPDLSRALQLEKELEQSRTEAEELRDRIKQFEEQTPQLEKELEQSRTKVEKLRDRVEQLEEQTADTTRTERTESEARSDLQETLSRSVNREKELTENLKMKAAELDQYRLEETQRGEARELKYYRLLESECTRWKTREQRALDELDHMRRAREENAMDGTLTRQLAEAQQQEQHLQELITGRDNSISRLEEQLETCQSQDQHLREQLETCQSQDKHLQEQLEACQSQDQHLREQQETCQSQDQHLREQLETCQLENQRLRVELRESRDKESGTQTITPPSHGLHVTATPFTPAVRFSLPGQANVVGTRSLSSCFSFAGLGATSQTAATSVSSSLTTPSTVSYSPIMTTTITGGQTTQPLLVPTESASTTVTTPFASHLVISVQVLTQD